MRTTKKELRDIAAYTVIVPQFFFVFLSFSLCGIAFYRRGQRPQPRFAAMRAAKLSSRSRFSSILRAKAAAARKSSSSG